MAKKYTHHYIWAARQPVPMKSLTMHNPKNHNPKKLTQIISVNINLPDRTNHVIPLKTLISSVSNEIANARRWWFTVEGTDHIDQYRIQGMDIKSAREYLLCIRDATVEIFNNTVFADPDYLAKYATVDEPDRLNTDRDYSPSRVVDIKQILVDAGCSLEQIARVSDRMKQDGLTLTNEKVIP
ncbi:hypothetical protein EniLVp02_0251 [Vibrio phage EniLVp02]